MTSDIQAILQMLQRQSTLGPPAYSTLASSPEYNKPAIRVQPVIAGHTQSPDLEKPSEKNNPKDRTLPTTMETSADVSRIKDSELEAELKPTQETEPDSSHKGTTPGHHRLSSDPGLPGSRH
ncbi:potassium voltage-gated channel subfamily H member 7 isoform X1 [Tachysurus ichikawai]